MMFKPKPRLSTVGVLLLAWTVPVAGQSLQDRIDDLRERRAREAARAAAVSPDLQVNARLSQRINFQVGWVTVREALDRWSRQTGIPMVINWEAMEIDGIDPDAELEIELEGVPADTVLLRIMDAMSADFDFIAEAYDWGIQLRTKEQANPDVITRVYDVTDLVMNVPNFDDAPSLSLTDALSNTGEGSGSRSIFDVEGTEGRDRDLTKTERGELLIQLVRDTIEPEVWQENGGEFSRIRYRQGRMIVRAPLYVQVQIGRAAIE